MTEPLPLDRFLSESILIALSQMAALQDRRVPTVSTGRIEALAGAGESTAKLRRRLASSFESASAEPAGSDQSVERILDAMTWGE